MSNYNIFKEVVTMKIQDEVEDRFPGASLSVEKRMKVNEVKDALYVRIPGEDISPVIYLDDLYKSYLNNNDMEEIVNHALNILEKESIVSLDIPHVDEDLIKERVVYQLINYEQNEELLKNIPFRKWNDLAIVYRVVIKMNEEGMQSFLINNDTARVYKLSEEELYSLASENTEQLMPTEVVSMTKMLKELGMIDLEDICISEEPDLYVITNKYRVNGASAILCEEKLFELSQMYDVDLYLIPSSIHEYLALPAGPECNADELAEMVKTVNMTEVNINERLSNQVYKYDKELREVKLATDTPQKSIEKYNITDRLR